MWFLSRLLGLIIAVVPGLGSLVFSVLLVQRWPDLGLLKGVFYSAMCAVTGAVCIYLGLSLLLARKDRQSLDSSVADLPVAVPEGVPSRPIQPVLPQPATDSIFAATEESAPAENVVATPMLIEPVAPLTPADTPEARIRRLAQSRPGWQITAPQLAQLANLGLSITDATARQMAQEDRNVEVQTGPHGEVVYLFNLANNGSGEGSIG